MALTSVPEPTLTPHYRTLRFQLVIFAILIDFSLELQTPLVRNRPSLDMPTPA
jgi:hypothetical protein